MVKPKRYFAVRFTPDHEWINYDENTKTGVVGITDYAQSQLGDIVHITLPKVLEKFKQKDVMATIESVKVVGDIYAPVSGTVTDVNEEVHKTPEIINQEAEGKGWLFKMNIDNLDEINKLLDKKEYEKVVQESGH
ncbi:hypothetical protein SteCoe_12878 [Stentor coeruleus]|uniref:Glycine cleavage system H protein n=1 Tax=Stentor coeruleus TaxID=5963 RepID=A0A1R2C9V2_9CILI|nr:hypothetical protein SteCoe_12878 [Stentor coeruleus]